LQGEKPVYLIGIIEHESEVNFTMVLKLLQYITYVLTDFVKENDKEYNEELEKTGETKLKLSNSKDFKLPPVLPVVFYDGGKKWTSSLNLLDRLLRKVDIPKENIDAITEKIYKRRFVDMFNVEFSIKDIREEGIKEGIIRGERKSSIEMARKLLIKGISIKDIVDVTGLNEEFIATLNKKS